VAAALLCAGWAGFAATPAPAVTISQHPLPGAASGAVGIAAAPGGLAITRVERQSTTMLERISTAPFSPGPLQPVAALTLGEGPDGEPWLAVVTGAAGTVELERATATGGLEPRFAFPLTLGSRSWPEQLSAGPDGSVWIANMTGGALERLSPDGRLTSYALPRAGAPTSVALAGDGTVWFTDPVTGTVGELTAAGTIVEHPLGGAAPGAFGNAEPFDIALGGDGAMWFTEQAAGRIGRISTSGALQEYAIPNTSGVAQGEYGSPAPRYIAAGPDGAMWFTDGGDESIGRITTGGIASEYPIGTPTPASPQGIVSEGGELWFAEAGLSALGSVDPAGVPAPAPAKPAARPRAASLTKRCRTHRPPRRRRSCAARHGHRSPGRRGRGVQARA